MSDYKRKTSSGPSGPYRHLIGGEYKGRRHEPGDRVDATPQKIAEWLKAGIIEPDKKRKEST